MPSRTGIIGGASLNLTLPSGAFTESDGGALSYTAMVLIPEHDLDYPVNGGTDVATRTIAAQWVALSTVGLAINATSGAITGVPATLDYVTSTYGAGSSVHATAYQIEVIATNAQHGTASGTFTLTNSYAPPTPVTALANHSANPGAGWVAVVPAGAFTDPYGDTLTYTATLSTGAALPSGLTWSGTSISVGAVSSGSYAITVTAHGIGGTASATFTLAVANVAPVISGALSNRTVVQGTAMTAYQVPAATDANGDAITYSASGLPTGISFNASTRTFSGTPTATGAHTITYTATDSKGAHTSATFVLTVNAPAPTPPIYNGGIPATIYFNYGLSNSYAFASHFTNPAGRALTYSLSGTALPVNFSFNTTTGVLSTSVLGNVRNDHDVGNFVVKATDAVDGLSVSVTFDLYLDGTGAGTQVVGGGPVQMTQEATDAQTETTGTTPNIQSYWFTYDADNRVAVNNGALVNGQIVVTQGGYDTPSYANQYDASGNVAIRITNDGTSQQQRLVYDARNELVETDFAVSTSATLGSLGRQQSISYDADGRQQVVANYYRNDARASATHTPDFPQGVEYMPIGGWLQSAQITQYNTDGTVSSQSSWGRDGDWQRAVIMAVNYNDETLPDEFDISASGSGPLDRDSITQYTGYDHVGNVTAYSYDQPSQSYPTYQAPYGATYTVSYLKKDGYLEQRTAGTPTVTGYIPATDTSYYDAFGRRTAVSQTSDSGSGTSQTTTRVFGYDTSGEIVQRRSGTVSGSTFTATGGYATDHYVYVEGQQVGMLDEGGGIHVLDTLTGFSDSPSTQGYVVQAGDTLAGIAQAVYGDSQYGYLIADANGLNPDDTLTMGQAITLPSITTSSNTSGTFKPYNPNEIVGSTTPSLPMPPPPPSQAGCSTLAMIVIIAVVVVATVLTAGAAAVAMGAEGSLWAAGSAAMVGASSAGIGVSMAAAAVGGFAGSVAGQLTGDALGVSHGFSLKEAVGAGIGAGLTAGLGGEISGGAKLSELSTAAHEGSAVAYAQIAGVGASSVVGNYAGEKLVNEPAHFSWANVAATALATEATTALHLPSTLQQQWGDVAGGTFASNVAGGLVNGAIDSETARLLGGQGVNGRQIVEDAFGNALANGVIGAFEAQEAKKAYDPKKDQLLWNIRTHGAQQAFEQSAFDDASTSASSFAFTAEGTSSEATGGSYGLGGSSLWAFAAGGTGGYPSSPYGMSKDGVLYAGSSSSGDGSLLEVSSVGSMPRIDVTRADFAANPTGYAAEQLGDDLNWTSKGAQLLDMGYAHDPDSIMAADQAYVDAVNSGGAKGYGYAPNLVAIADDKINTAIALNGLNAQLLPTVTVSGATPDEIAYQASYTQEVAIHKMEVDYVKVNLERKQEAQANQQQIVMLNNVWKNSANQALPYFVGPALAGGSVAFSTGGAAWLVASSKAVSAVSGAAGGYISDGWKGALVGLGVGLIAGNVPGGLSEAAIGRFGTGLLGNSAATTAFSVGSGTVSLLSTVTTNVVSGHDILENSGKSFALGTFIPLASGEAFVAGVGGEVAFGASVNGAFGLYSGLLGAGAAVLDQKSEHGYLQKSNK